MELWRCHTFDQYFKETAPENYRFLDYYQYRKGQDDFTNNFRLEARRLKKCLEYLVENGSNIEKHAAQRLPKGLQLDCIIWPSSNPEKGNTHTTMVGACVPPDLMAFIRFRCAPKMIDTISPDILQKIFLNLRDDFQTLNRCIRVNRHWSQNAIWELWRDPFSLSRYKDPKKILKAYLAFMEKKSRKEIKRLRVISRTSKPVTFCYPSMLRVLNFEKLYQFVQLISVRRQYRASKTGIPKERRNKILLKAIVGVVSHCQAELEEIVLLTGPGFFELDITHQLGTIFSPLFANNGICVKLVNRLTIGNKFLLCAGINRSLAIYCESIQNLSLYYDGIITNENEQRIRNSHIPPSIVRPIIAIETAIEEYYAELINNQENLTEVYLSGWEDLADLKGLTKLVSALTSHSPSSLRSLTFLGCQFDPLVFNSDWTILKSLKSLRFEYCAGLKDLVFSRMENFNFPQLATFFMGRDFSFPHIIKIKHDKVGFLAKFFENAAPNLQEIRLPHVHLELYPGLLRVFPRCLNLRVLEIHIKWAEEMKVLISNLESFSKLECLDISGEYDGYEEQEIQDFENILPDLGLRIPYNFQRFTMTVYCTFSAKSFVGFLQNLPKLPNELRFVVPQDPTVYYDLMHKEALVDGRRIVDGGWTEEFRPEIYLKLLP
ncbi:hypothetical protein G9A89_014711 [Geosiphon pyriformis]|nr:hypothetical protein G9A89_014711 [Geosiphon pyriformis]